MSSEVDGFKSVTNSQCDVHIPVEGNYGPVRNLIPDVWVNICLYDLSSYTPCLLVCKEWNTILVNQNVVGAVKRVVYDRYAFGPQKWAECMGNDVPIEEEKAAYDMLPNNIFQILFRACPAFPESGKCIGETHKLVYIGNELTLTALGKAVERYLSQEKKRLVPGYEYIWDKALQKFDKPQDQKRGYWVLMTDDILGGDDLKNGSRNKSYSIQQEMVRELSKRAKVEYSVPKTREAAAVIFAHFLSTRECLFGRGKKFWTFTRCEEQLEGWQLAVGGFAPVGLYVNDHDYYLKGSIGVAGLRKFVS